MNKVNSFYESLLKTSSFTPIRLKFPDSWVGHLPFANWLIGILNPRTFVELGAHTGNSYFSFCQAVVEQNLQTKCYAVDAWQGDEHAGKYDDSVFKDVSSYNQENFERFSKLLRMTFDDALSHFPESSVDLLHIDGFDTYEAVKHVFEAWLPKLNPGAVVLFHDTTVRERGFGVWKLFDELKKKYPNNLNFLHSNGLGVIQIDNVGSDSLQWLDRSEDKVRLKEYFLAIGEKQSLKYSEKIISEQNRKIIEFTKSHEAALELQVTASELQDKVFYLTAERSRMQSEINAGNALISSLRSSTSWRITAPIRLIGRILRKIIRCFLSIIRFISPSLERGIIESAKALLSYLRGRTFPNNSSANFLAYSQLVDKRSNLAQTKLLKVSSSSTLNSKVWPKIDISVVTYNSSKWIDGFIESLCSLDYPRECLNIQFIDNNSSDETYSKLEVACKYLQQNHFGASVVKRPNLGFGAGHTYAMKSGAAAFCLVTNIDLTFESDSLRKVVSAALDDPKEVAAWELRQKPYEHPKYYDPLTGLTNWNSHACVLLRRSAVERVGYYDESLFMYGEDVELSYRLRREGYFLKYCSSAVVWHYAYEEANQVKPIQYTGSIYSHLYIRLKYGNLEDILAIPFMMRDVLGHPEAYPGSRKDLKKKFAKLVLNTPKALFTRRQSTAVFPFHAWDYDVIRDGAFIDLQPIPQNPPLVSIIIRTYAGRELYLRQSIHSALQQTWPNVEVVVVQDGSNSLESIVKEISCNTSRPIRYFVSESKGRSSAGNTGLKNAKGRWCQFLDDDDYLMQDHIEVLALALINNPDYVASYSLSMEVATDTSKIEEGLYFEQIPVARPEYYQAFDFNSLLMGNYLTIQSVLFERRLFEERGGMHEDMDALEDWTMWVRYAYGNQFLFVPKTTSIYRIFTDQKKLESRQKYLHDAFLLAKQRNNESIKRNN